MVHGFYGFNHGIWGKKGNGNGFEECCSNLNRLTVLLVRVIPCAGRVLIFQGGAQYPSRRLGGHAPTAVAVPNYYHFSVA